jgi:putative DNA primase/helicase
VSEANGTHEFRHVTATAPCPICRKPDWCSISTDGEVCACRRIAEGGEERTDKSGGTFYYHRLVERTANHTQPEPRFTLADGKGERADVDTLNRVYSALLDALPLDAHHQERLRARGLAGDLKAAGYRSLGRARYRAVASLRNAGLEELFPRVPGFFDKENERGKYWTVTGSEGFLIPVRDTAARIVALIVRPDFPQPGKKYTYISSKSRQGPGPGAPVHVPLFSGDTTTVRITEGALKADIATHLSKTLTIGLPGIAWKGAIPLLKRWRPETVLVAFDADAARNANVARAMLELVKALRAGGYAVALERWAEQDGKGIDDLLAAGKKPEIVTGDDALAAAVEIEWASRGGDPGKGAAQAEKAKAEENKVKEAVDDPHRLARLFLADRTDDDGRRLNYHLDEFTSWDGTAHRRLPDTELKALLSERIKREFDRVAKREHEAWERTGGKDENGRPVPEPCARKVSVRLVSDVTHALAGMTLLPSSLIPPAWIDATGFTSPFPAEEILACENRLVHVPSLADGKQCDIPATPRFFSPNALDYDYDPTPPAPAEWLNFLSCLWPDDAEAIGLLQEWAGYCLLPDTRQQKILMICGPKRSGKGTIARVLRGLIGMANTASPTLASLGTNFGLQPLIGRTLAIVSDARLSGRTDIAVVTERLLSISGEDAQTIDRKHQSALTLKLPVRFVILTNELPRLNDPSGALVGRLLILRQTKSFFGKEDTALTARLLTELPSILLWAVAGWKRLRDRGHFEQPASGMKLVQQMEDLSSPISEFLREHCVIDPGLEVPVRGLFGRWQQWCAAVGKKDPGSEQGFGRDLRAALPGLEDKRPRDGNGDRQRWYVGIGLRAETDDSYIPE